MLVKGTTGATAKMTLLKGTAGTTAKIITQLLHRMIGMAPDRLLTTGLGGTRNLLTQMKTHLLLKLKFKTVVLHRSHLRTASTTTLRVDWPWLSPKRKFAVFIRSQSRWQISSRSATQLPRRSNSLRHRDHVKIKPWPTTSAKFLHQS